MPDYVQLTAEELNALKVGDTVVYMAGKGDHLMIAKAEVAILPSPKYIQIVLKAIVTKGKMNIQKVGDFVQANPSDICRVAGRKKWVT